jgi:hypothetical protein
MEAKAEYLLATTSEKSFKQLILKYRQQTKR